MTFKQAKERLEVLGYGVHKDYRLDKNHPYTTYPMGSGGSINYFKDVAGLERYILQVEENRRMQGVM